jgi:periplasmic protein TonB
MFDSLLESRPRKSSRVGGSIVSTGAHIAMIAAIVAVTANAGVAREAPKEQNLIYTAPPPPPPPPPPAPAPDRVFAPPQVKGFATLVAPIEIPDVIPPIDFNKPLTRDDAWTGIGRPGGSPDGIATSGAPVTGTADNVFTRETVDRFVVMLPGSTGPAYPEMLRSAGVEGDVLAQFVVDTTGRADVATLQILQSDHQLFSDAVRKVLPKLRFIPAEVGGTKVRQLVQQPFRFGLARD